ncbi:MAG TPA: nucleotidyltransferase domain-containing protein [Clostridiales bacterium]|nr:nucleotidyltransferase domain-containing protein [Clostridiales bacterium]
MLENVIEKVPERYRNDLKRAVKILKSEGCKDVFLFGSLVSGGVDENSDIDLAIRGCPIGRYFSILAKLMVELDHPVDLVNLDKKDDFSRHLLEEGELIYVS